MSRLVETEAFVTVVQEGSFTTGASRLGVSSSYASKLVTRLENRLGIQLLRRTTRQLTLTEAGEQFFEDSARALELVARAEEAVGSLRANPRGRLRVTLPTGIGLAWLSRSLAEFMCAYPDIVMDVVYLDRIVDLVAEGFDLAIRVGSLPDSSLMVRRLAIVRRGLVASPGYLERHGRPSSPDQLREHACLVYSYQRAPTSWVLQRANETHAVAVSGPMIANSGSALVDAAAHGLGIAFLPEFHTAACRTSGELEVVLPEWGDQVPVHLLYPSARHVPAKVRAFIDHMVESLRDPPWQVG